MKKLSKITEGILGDIAKRDLSGGRKREDGRKVKTCLGIDIFLENPESEYNSYIRDTIDKNGFTEYDIIFEQELKYTDYKSIDAIKKNKPDYVYIIHEGYGHTGLVITFDSYKVILDFVLDDEFKNEYSEHDYKEICGCIAKKFEELSIYLQSAPRNKDISSLNNCNICQIYKGEYMLQLIDESDVAHWYYENDDINDEFNLNPFYEDFIYTFNDMKYEDFIIWSYSNSGCNIAIPITCDNMINFEKYRDYTKKWFNI